MKFTNSLHCARNCLPGLYAALLSLGVVHSAFAGLPAQHPVIVGTTVKPIMMLNMSRDHQLFFKLYDDYSDITNDEGTAPDTVPDTGYNNNYDYYGYFDSDKCYTYSSTNNRFEPTTWRTKATKSCDGTADWSGNFLNWSTMTRADAVRKILYGGHRVVDTAASGANSGVTVLERAFLPNDAHSFAKFYLPASTTVVADLKKVVPDGAATESGVTICNTTNPGAGGSVRPADANSTALSQNVDQPPLMKVAKGNYALWANNERWQCMWAEEKSGVVNGNISATSGIQAASGSPNRDSIAATRTQAAVPGVGFSPFNFNVRVQACVPGFIAGTSAAHDDYKTAVDNEKCKQYSAGNVKPTGLLHRYGETDQIRFGLITGSYAKNKSGGVLRKPASSFQDEVSLTTYNAAGALTSTGTGVFKAPTYSIVTTLNKLRIFGYNFFEGLYNIPPSGNGTNWYDVPTDQNYSDNCSWFGHSNSTGGVRPNKRAFFENGRCTNWGNPQAEIYLESLRYLAGAGAPTDAFNETDANKIDSKKITGLLTVPTAATSVTPGWSDPISESADGNYCAPLNVLQFNASTTSYDGDELSGVSGIGLSNVSALSAITKAVGDNEGITNGDYFVGKKVGGGHKDDGNQLCTAKSVSDLSVVNGLCPEAPRLEGSYQLAGLAYHARSTGLPAKTTYGREKVRTFGVALAPAVPKVTIKTESGKSFTILPACRSTSTAGSINQILNGVTTSYAGVPGNCAIVDFKIVQPYTEANGGKVYVSWEDMEQGGDYDQDMWGIISYKVVGDTLSVTTNVIAESSADGLGFGYVVSGVTDSGFKVHSGIRGFTMADTGCSGGCNLANPPLATTASYQLGSSPAKNLEDPLFYAAKWGGYSEDFEQGVAKDEDADLTAAIKGRDPSDSYYYATDPRALEESLEEAFNNIAATVGASATVAANSTRLDGETYVYQARFNSEDWSGDILAFPVNTENGSVDTDPKAAKWKASDTVGRTGRKIYTYDGASTPSLVSLTNGGAAAAPTLRAALKLSGEADYARADSRFNWLLGSGADESGANLRKREVILGDIVNSDPAFAGAGNLRYRFLPTAYGGDLFQAFANEKRELNTDKKRKWRSLLLVGANDGMMHAFDAEDGEEVFAYIPRGVYAKLADLSSLQYRHQYTVDGPISIGDIYVDSDSNGVGGEWRTIAVGTLGAGGRGAYALDITDVLKSSTGTPKVIFDVSADDASTDTTLKNALGYSMSRPLIVPTRDLNWRVIFGNGPNSIDGTASLIAIDPEDPSNYTVINTGAKISETSNDNGLFGVALLPDGDGVSEAAYGGDLMGNMWKFDLSATSKSSWDVAYSSGETKLPLARVVDPSGNVQPITTTPTLGINAVKTRTGEGNTVLPSIMVYFGTGKYYETSDPTNMQIQSVYGIADMGVKDESLIFTNNASRREALEEKEITAETTGTPSKRTVSNDATPASGVHEVNWANKSGWFMDLKLNTGLADGERVVGKPLLVYDRLIFATFIPSTNQCKYGGVGWLMELTGVGDKYIGKSVLGVNANTALDTVILGDLIALTSGDNLYVMGSGLGKKGSEPPIISKLGNNFGDKGRISWQQLK